MVAHNIYEISLVSKFVSSWKNIVSLRRTYDTSNSKVLFKIKPQKIRNKTPNFQNLTSICLKEKSNYITKSKLDFYYTIQPTHTQKKRRKLLPTFEEFRKKSTRKLYLHYEARPFNADLSIEISIERQLMGNLSILSDGIKEELLSG